MCARVCVVVLFYDFSIFFIVFSCFAICCFLTHGQVGSKDALARSMMLCLGRVFLFFVAGACFCSGRRHVSISDALLCGTGDRRLCPVRLLSWGGLEETDAVPK